MSLYSRIRSGNKDLRVQMSEQQDKLTVAEQHSDEAAWQLTIMARSTLEGDWEGKQCLGHAGMAP